MTTLQERGEAVDSAADSVEEMVLRVIPTLLIKRELKGKEDSSKEEEAAVDRGVEVEEVVVDSVLVVAAVLAGSESSKEEVEATARKFVVFLPFLIILFLQKKNLFENENLHSRDMFLLPRIVLFVVL